ncbi:MAG TPA: dihydropteroate synthase [Gemmatimonadota bacterium]
MAAADPAADAFAPAALISGDPSAFLELVTALRWSGGPGPALAAEVDRALIPTAPAAWRLRTRALALDRPLVMGIVNVTPDSFSDGGSFVAPEAAVRHGVELVEAGADLLDVGGESTRPGAERVEAGAEEGRVIPVVARLAALGIPVSVDTTRARVAWRAIESGAEIVNDVSALRFDPGLGAVVARAGAGLVLMHMRGTPETMQRDPRYQDVMGELLDFFEVALANAALAGVERERCVVDPGIGFGKRLVDNAEILYRLEELGGLGRPVLVGPSRKAFLDPERRLAPADRLPETIAAACLAAVGGAHIFRVHDARECRRALDFVRRIQAPLAEA